MEEYQINGRSRAEEDPCIGDWHMRFEDFTLLGKKILVGALVTVMPFIILFAGFRLTEKILTKSTKNQPSSLNIK
jgi:hypothetical protein